MRQQYHLEGKHVIGHVGRFMAQKNHTFLLDVFAAYKKEDKDAYLVLLGDGELMETVKNKAKELGVADSVLFVGMSAMQMNGIRHLMYLCFRLYGKDFP